MKDAIEATSSELKDWKTKLEYVAKRDREVGQSHETRGAPSETGSFSWSPR